MNRKVIVVENDSIVYQNEQVSPLIVNLTKGFEILGRNIWKEQVSYLNFGEFVVSLKRIKTKLFIVIDDKKADFNSVLEENNGELLK